MSRGPTTAVGMDQGGDYQAAFQAANRMVNQGMSWSGYERNRCFLNTGQLRFADVSGTTGLDFLDDSRAIASVDWDHDGDLDLIQVNRTAPQIRMLCNEWTGRGNWIAVRLVGTKCNRDAIGARVELYRRGNAAPDIQTLYAGHSFLSQSSKWLHFGLGDSKEIEKIVVRWPGQSAETFSDVTVNQRYHLVEGIGTADVLDRAGEGSPCSHEAPLPDPEERARILLSARVPVPKLKYRSFDDTPADVPRHGPTLIQLWASWCPMCQEEISEFAQQAESIRQAGVDVVALSVDGLGSDTSTDDKAKRAIDQLRFPFASGFATERLLTKLEVLRGELFANLEPFPIPTSFLLDGEGRLTAVYLGPLKVGQLLSDLQWLDVSDAQRRELGTPFAGRWFTPPKPIRLATLASRYREAQFPDVADWYQRQAIPQRALGHCSLALDLERQGELRAARTHFRQALELDPQSPRVHHLFGKYLLRRRELAEAKLRFQEASRLDNTLAEAHYGLATAHLVSGDQNSAKASYLRTIDADPKHAPAHAALGRLLLAERQWELAEQHLELAVRANPNLAPPYVYLSSIYTQRQQPERALGLLRKAIQVQPDLVDAHEMLGEILFRQQRYAEAVSSYRRAVQLGPDLPTPAFKLAWHLATRPQLTKQSPDEAVKLAERLVRATRDRSPHMLDLLGATLADAGQYESAARAARQALALKPANPELVKKIQQRLALYDQGLPFRATSEPSP